MPIGTKITYDPIIDAYFTENGRYVFKRKAIHNSKYWKEVESFKPRYRSSSKELAQLLMEIKKFLKNFQDLYPNKTLFNAYKIWKQEKATDFSFMEFMVGIMFQFWLGSRMGQKAFLQDDESIPLAPFIDYAQRQMQLWDDQLNTPEADSDTDDDVHILNEGTKL